MQEEDSCCSLIAKCDLYQPTACKRQRPHLLLVAPSLSCLQCQHHCKPFIPSNSQPLTCGTYILYWWPHLSRNADSALTAACLHSQNEQTQDVHVGQRQAALSTPSLVENTLEPHFHKTPRPAHTHTHLCNVTPNCSYNCKLAHRYNTIALSLPNDSDLPLPNTPTRTCAA